MTRPVSPVSYGTWPDLVKSLDTSNGVLPVRMEQLRLAEGAQRLGPNVVDAVEEHLKLLGLGHLPTTLPNRADEPVILYRHGTLAAEVVRAIQEGLRGNVVDATVSALRQVNAPLPPQDLIPADDVSEKVGVVVEVLRDLMELTNGNQSRHH